MDDEETFELDPQTQIQVLRQQRNAALDAAALWQGVAATERRANRELAKRIAELEPEVEAEVVPESRG